MPPKRDTRYNSDDVIAARLDKMEQQVRELVTGKILTAPSYDSANFPANAVEGQVAIAEGTSSPGGSSIDTFAITLDSDITINDSPIEIDGSTTTMHFSTNGTSFSESVNGRAQITRAGLYVIGMQIEIESIVDTVGDTFFESQLGYGTSLGSLGYGIEVPWMGFGLGNELILGTYYEFPDGKTAGHAVSLQRIHPISVDDDVFPAFPFEIHMKLYSGDTGSNYNIRWGSLWGFRLGDPLDSWHSD